MKIATDLAIARQQVDGHDVRQIDGLTALASLVRELPLSVRAPARIPSHLLMAGIPYGDTHNAVEEGRDHLLPVIATNADDLSITVAGVLQPGTSLFWALRQPRAAEQDMVATVAACGYPS